MSEGELTFMRAIEVRDGIMALMAVLSLGQRWEVVRNVTLGEWKKVK